MGTKRRQFSHDEKLRILQYAAQSGVIQVLHEYKLSYSVFARWKRQLMPPDPNAPPRAPVQKTKMEMEQLLEENLRLKKIIAEQAVQLEQKEEELKRYTSFNKR
jgi:transposase-like protein